MHPQKSKNPSVHVLDQPNGAFRENIQNWSGFLSLNSSKRLGLGRVTSAVCFHDCFISVSSQNLCPAIMETRVSGDSGVFLHNGNLGSSQQSGTMSSLQATLYLSLRFISLSLREKSTRKETLYLELLIFILAFRNIMNTENVKKKLILFINVPSIATSSEKIQDIGITTMPMSHLSYFNHVLICTCHGWEFCIKKKTVFTFCPYEHTWIEKSAFDRNSIQWMSHVCMCFQAHIAVPLEHTYLADGE